MDISTTLFVLGFVFSSIILLTIGFQEVWRDIARWRGTHGQAYIHETQHNRPDPVLLRKWGAEQL